MIELHLHLDGSLSENDFRYLAEKQGISLGDDFPSSIYVPENCPSLTDYLKRFDLPLKMLQTYETLEYATESLVSRLYNAGCVYAEIRYAPQLHIQKGMSQEDAVKAAVSGLRKALAKTKDFSVGLILCTMRHAPESVNMETIEIAGKYKGTEVVGVDLAGDETLHPCSYYSNVFSRARELGLNITIHAGEATGSDEILMAVNNGATRIGHGVHLNFDENTLKIIKNKHICFEFCPTSNLQTKSIPSYPDFPLIAFRDADIPVTISSDNMTVSNTDVVHEFAHLQKTFSLGKEEILKYLYTSIEYSFADNRTKEKYRKLVDARIDAFYQTILSL